MKNEHISEHKLISFYKGKASGNEYINILEHISICDKCATDYARCIEEDIISAPVDFKQNIVRKSKVIQTKKESISKKKAFNGYCIRVGLSCAAAIVLIFSMDVNKINEASEKLNVVLDYDVGIEIETYMEQGQKSIKEFFEKLEVNYDKEEK